MLGRTSSIRGSIGDVAMMGEMLVGGIKAAGNGAPYSTAVLLGMCREMIRC